MTVADSCWLQWILDYSQKKTQTLENIYFLAFLVTGQFLKLHVWDIWDGLSKANSVELLSTTQVKNRMPLCNHYFAPASLYTASALTISLE